MGVRYKQAYLRNENGTGNKEIVLETIIDNKQLQDFFYFLINYLKKTCT